MVTIQDLLAAFGGIACIGGGVAYLVKLWNWIKSPNDTQNERLNEQDLVLKKHMELLENDDKRIASLEEQDKLVMTALLALLSHGIDGNDVDAMRDAKDKIQKFLISK